MYFCILLVIQGSFQSLHGAAASDYQNLLHFQNANSSQLQQASNSSPSSQQQQYYQQQQHASNAVHQQQPYRQHLNSVTSSDSLSGGNARSRVNSDSNNSKYNINSSNSARNSGKSSNNNPPLSSDKKCANGANQNSSNRNLSNNNVNSSSNNLSNNPTNSNNNHLRQRHIIELNRQVSELNSKNIEFNRQLSAPAENQNSCNSVYNLYSNHILNNQYSGSPNTNSLNRTKKKRSFKLNGR